MKTVAAYVHQVETPPVSPVVDASRVFYVTVRNGERTGWLLGPYDDHADALANVDRARELAVGADPWAVFYCFGTASLPRGGKQPKVIFS